MLPPRRALSLTKTVKDVWQEFRVDSFTIILHDDGNASGLSFQLHLDAAIIGRKFDCVSKKIPDDLLQTRAISRHQSSSWIQLELQHHTLGIGRRTHSLSCRFDDWNQINHTALKTKLARNNARHIQQVRDKLGLRFGITRNSLKATSRSLF